MLIVRVGAHKSCYVRFEYVPIYLSGIKHCSKVFSLRNKFLLFIPETTTETTF